MNLGKNVKLTAALDYASGTATRNGATLDMAGFESVMVVMTLATIAASAVGDIHMEQDSASGFGTGADLAGTAIAVAADDDNQIFIIDLVKPTERYVRAVVTKNGSNAQAESVVYIQYSGKKRPEVNAVADTVSYELHVTPAEGTK